MSKLKNIAVLIDADNISSQRIDWVFAQIQTLGMITTKRIYGDFAKSHLSSWESAILKYAIEKKHQTSYSTGKNSSDIALAIDAMDLLYTHQCDAFCIVSSDSDFIGLALRLRRNNIQVFGFGENKTIKEFRQVCSQFFEIGDNNQTKSNTLNTSTIKKFTANELKCDSKLLNALRESVEKTLKSNWANYAQINSYLQQKYAQLKPSDYGYEKWSDILLMIDLFECKKLENVIFFRLKNKNLNHVEPIQKYTSDKLKQDSVLINAIRESINKYLVNGWADYSSFHTYLNTNFPKININKYGYSKWRSLINQIDLFEFSMIDKKLFIREKINSKTNLATVEKNQDTTLNHQQLLSDMLQIINENTVRVDEWVHIGYLGSQLKNKGYQPNDFGFKSFTELLSSVNGIIMRKNENTIYFTLADKSKIKAINSVKQSVKPLSQNLKVSDSQNQIESNIAGTVVVLPDGSNSKNVSAKETIESAKQNFEETSCYKLLVHNKNQIHQKIKEYLDKGTQLKFYDIWRMVHQSLSNHIQVSDKESWACFMYFFKKNLIMFNLKLDNDILYII